MNVKHYFVACFFIPCMLTTQEISQLSTLSSDKARAGVQAQNWLHLLDNKTAQTEARWGTDSQALQARPDIGHPFGQNAQTAIALPELVSVAPNPSSTVFRFTSKLNAITELRIFNATGQLVQHHQLEGEASTFDWQPATHESALYFYQVLDTDGNISQMGKMVFLGL